MQDLKLIGVHEDGDHLLLADGDGGRYRLALDDALRAAARRDRPRLGQLQIEIEGGLRPRDVQSLIRSGLSTEEVAGRSGWTVEKVRRFEGPVLAEREFIANKARATVLAHDGKSAETFGERVETRLRDRGVAADQVQWDSQRLDSGQWVVTVTFPAGGRERTGSWRFDPTMQQVRAQNDDARFLSEDERGGSLPTPHVAEGGRTEEVFDVTAPVRGSRPRTRSAAGEEDELTESLRAHHSSLRGRRTRRRTGPGTAPGEHLSPVDALPLEPLVGSVEEWGPPPDRPRAAPEAVEAIEPIEPIEPSEQAGSEKQPQSQEPGSAPAAADAGRKGRTRVPSWDDVVFGARAPRDPRA